LNVTRNEKFLRFQRTSLHNGPSVESGRTDHHQFQLEQTQGRHISGRSQGIPQSLAPKASPQAIRIPDRTDKNRSAICKTGLLELLEIGEIRSLERKVTKNTPRFAPVTIRVLYFHSRCTEATTRRRFHNDSLRGRHSNSTTSGRGHEENRSQDFFQRRKLPQSPTRTLISKGTHM
jgi:hypothetical protein